MHPHDNYARMSDFIEEHLVFLKCEGYSPNTIRDRRRCLKRLHADLPYGLAGACQEQLHAWLGYDGWTPATRYTYTGHVVEFCRWLVAAGYLAEDPSRGIRRPRVPVRPIRVATDHQLAVALTAPEPLRTAVILAAYGGLRRAEAAACRREHITEETITIMAAKGGDTQTVPTHAAVWEHVRDLLDGPVCPDRDGREISPERLGAMALRWFRRQGWPGFGLHHFRRRYGTMIQRATGDIRITQECLRHRSLATTMIYTQVSDTQRRRAIESLRWVEHRPGLNGPVPPAPEA